MSRLLTEGLARAPQRFRTLIDTFLRHERLRVYLAHDALAICLIRGRFRRTVAEKGTIELPALAPSAQHDITDALVALTNWMETRSFNGKIEWIVGLDHVRYLLLPWDERLSSMSFCRTLAKALFAQQLYGDDASLLSGMLRFAPLSYGRPRLAALIPEEIVRALMLFFWRERRRTTRITPALALVWDRFFDRFRKGAGTLALAEGQRLLHVDYEHGNIVALFVRPFAETRARSAFSAADFMFPPTGFDAHADQELQLDGLAPDDDKRIAYALCGVL